MHTEEDEVSVASKKKLDKGQSSSDVSASPDKAGPKKAGKSDGEDPKPRIVLTFRSDKKNSNMKIVSNDEKTEEFSPRRSGRTRHKWEWTEETEASRRLQPKKEKNSSQSVSENDETSDSSHTPLKRSTRRRSKDSSENVLANAIARKEKSYNEPPPGPTQRLSRRIKPTAKILANEELRIGLESQNNVRLGLQSDKPEEGVRTRKAAQSMQVESESNPEAETSKKETRSSKQSEDDTLEIEQKTAEQMTPENKQSEDTVMKLKHLCELGLKAINPEALEEDAEEELDEEVEEGCEEEIEEDLENEENDEIDDESEVIRKLLEQDEEEDDTSDEDYIESQYSSIGTSMLTRSRRSTRLSPSARSRAAMSDKDEYQEYRPVRKRNRLPRNEEVPPEEEEHDDSINREYRPARKRNRLPRNEEVQPEIDEHDDSNNSEPAGGDDGSEPACPEDSTPDATCFCEQPSNVHASATELTEPVFCQAIEVVEGVRVGCSHAAARTPGGTLAPLLRAGLRAPFLLACALHAAQLRRHMCCPACGIFCTEGTFYQCSLGHLFHLECGLPYNNVKQKPGCPHCGVHSYWQPVNQDCVKVRVRMHCSNKRILLPDQREQCTPAYLSFSITEPCQADASPLIPEDLLPSPPIDLKRLCQLNENADYDEILSTTPAQRLCDAILAGESVVDLLPKIVSRACVNTALPSQQGGTSLHVACARGHVGALYALQYAGAHLDVPDAHQATPLLRAVAALLQKSEKKSPAKSRKMNERGSKNDSKEIEQDKDKEEKESISDKKEECEMTIVKDEDLVKVIRYLVAAGCDVNYQGAEGMTALHMAAQHGHAAAAGALLEAATVQVDARDHGGWTPLVWAAENGHCDVLRLLLSRGAEAATSDSEGNGAVHWCALAGHAPALRLLLEHAPHAADAPNAHNDTPLHVAARQGHYACVVVLLARGARTDVENSDGELPVEVCSGSAQSAISLNMQMSLVLKDSHEDGKRHKLLSSDISNGSEMFPIPCVNEIDDEPLPDDFTYVTENLMPEPLAIDNTIQSMQGCTCTSGTCASSCACCVLSVRAWVRGGRLVPAFPHHDPPMLFECNPTCRCNKRKCGNMLISRLKARGSVFVRSVVYRTRGAGWGLRAAAHVPRGTPAALYCGELLPLPSADTRANDQYLFALDVKPDLLEQCTDKTILCVDACVYGSAARFINHSCKPNLAPVRVFTSTRDLRLPTVALVATADIKPGEQFTFDYGEKFWSVKVKWMKCECGSAECRYPEKITEDTN